MNLKEAQYLAASIMSEKDYSIIQIGKAFEQVINNVHLMRTYIREENVGIVGCLAAIKHGDKVVFGFSSISPEDYGFIVPKKVTGLIAAAQAYLEIGSNVIIPNRFAHLFEDNKDESGSFIEGCADHFKVNTIEAIVQAPIICKGRRTGYTPENITLTYQPLKNGEKGIELISRSVTSFGLPECLG